MKVERFAVDVGFPRECADGNLPVIRACEQVLVSVEQRAFRFEDAPIGFSRSRKLRGVCTLG